MTITNEKLSFTVTKLKDDRIVIDSPYESTSTIIHPMLVISSTVIQLRDKKLVNTLPSNTTIQFQCVGILGILDLTFGRYLLLATEKKLSSTLQSHKIWSVTKAVCLGIGFNINPHDTTLLKKMTQEDLARYTIDKAFIDQITTLMCSGRLYFSTTYDLTHSLQHNTILSKNKTQTETTIDDRYLFNKNLLLPFKDVKQQCVSWQMKCILGYVGEVEIAILGRLYTVILVSRVNCNRLGTRYLRRGLDQEGTAANSVEMEQIMFNSNLIESLKITSFVQLRGSVPLVWTQEIDLSYKPKLVIKDTIESWSPIKHHLTDLTKMYPCKNSGNVVCVDLLDSGFEGQLSIKFEESIKQFGNLDIQYEHFSVNKWCKKLDYRNMDILVARILGRMRQSGFYCANGLASGLTTYTEQLEVESIQQGFIRVNCLDSLDRTNLTCSKFAKAMITNQSVYLGLDPQDFLQHFNIASKGYTNMWADSGDAISMLYAGTGALKSDITRNGKRNMVGPVNDGINSLTRYFLNNFSDGFKQDTYDLLTGRATQKDFLYLIEKNDSFKALKHPFIEKSSGLGRFCPGFLVDTVEPFLQAAASFTSSKRQNISVNSQNRVNGNQVDTLQKPQTYVGFCLTILKLAAPSKVEGILEFGVAMIVCVYVCALVKVFEINGQDIVGKQKFKNTVSVDDLD